MAQGKRWCFTLNNYTDGDEERLRGLDVKYLCVGREVAPTTGTRHLQGFVNFRTCQRFNKARELIGTSAHLELAKGTDVQNKEYCCKSADFFEVCVQGQRTDLAAVAAACAVRGNSLEKVALEHPQEFIKYHRGIQRYYEIANPIQHRDFKTRVHVFVGPPGSGKSRLANACGEVNGEIYYKPRGEWWDGYRDQSTIVVDDFYGWLKYDELLKICDRYPYKVPVKGAYVEFTARNIFITSNEPIDNWYKFNGYDPAAIKRRVSVYMFINGLEPVYYIGPDDEWLSLKVKAEFKIACQNVLLDLDNN
ncbi:replication-associated protein [Soft spider associated circular virus 1]|uniref:Replication-associated protein n=1 Tax=Soft spider associated circular virus 1 TaxID=2293301 RepID=A0A346BP96_9CIRC|nr:replication-associated protein [Soft spider associated circular virus 1]AXL65893.1 replication-associated protein [Soft spider associated circular virus 1]